jgi:hypothetical protein
MSTLAVNTITNAAGGNTAQINGMTPTAQSLQGFRNRILNGGMVIDQRNAGASSTFSTSYVTVDRWRPSSNNSTAVMTLQQNAGSVTPPAGFANYLGLTVTTAQASLSADTGVRMLQFIEGFNTADLGFGTASASSVTLSFWVRSSITGLYGAYFTNSAFNRTYVASYTINAANTWEYKTITIPGDTTGTWLTNNGVGIRVGFSLAAGTSFQTTPGSWTASAVEAPTGQTNLTGTLGATWQVTGVQLEAGSVATPFERRPYGTELALCQRYCCVFSGANSYYARKPIFGTGSNTAFWYAQHPVPMRITPSTLTAVNVTSGTFEGFNYTTSTALGNITNATLTEGDNFVSPINFTFASGITSGQVGSWRWFSTPTASFILSAEL